MAATDILYEKRGATALITLNRPEVLNAWRRGMVTLYLQHLDTAAKDDEVKAVILTGAGRAFSSGDDLKEEHSRLPATSTLKDAYGVLVELQEATRRMVGHPKIIICAMNGVAVGMGAELALASDLCIVSTLQNTLSN